MKIKKGKKTMKTATLTALIILSLLAIVLTGCGQYSSGSNPKLVSWEMTPAGVFVPRYELVE